MKVELDLYNIQGQKVGKVDLPAEVFAAPINPPLMAQAVRVYLANQRQGTHKTKTRGEVRGGGKKPWRQKHTGRARHGSIRSPIWVGGGHAKAKQPRDYSLKLPKKMRRAALFSALTLSRSEGRIKIVQNLEWKEIKTRQALELLEKLQLERKVLLITAENEPVIWKSCRNLKPMRVLEARELNPYFVLRYPQLVILEPAIEKIKETFLS